MSAHRIFFQGWEIRGLVRKSPGGVQGWSPGVGLWTKPPEAHDRL